MHILIKRKINKSNDLKLKVIQILIQLLIKIIVPIFFKRLQPVIMKIRYVLKYNKYFQILKKIKNLYK